MASNSDAADRSIALMTQIGGTAVRVSFRVAGAGARTAVSLIAAVLANRRNTRAQEELREMILMKDPEGIQIMNMPSDRYSELKKQAGALGVQVCAAKNMGRPDVTTVTFPTRYLGAVNEILSQMRVTVDLIAEIKDIKTQELGDIGQETFPDVVVENMEAREEYPETVPDERTVLSDRDNSDRFIGEVLNRDSAGDSSLSGRPGDDIDRYETGIMKDSERKGFPDTTSKPPLKERLAELRHGGSPGRIPEEAKDLGNTVENMNEAVKEMYDRK